MNEETKPYKMVIRKLSLEDLPTRVEWMNNPLVYRSMHFDIPVMMDRTIEWFHRNENRKDRVDFSFLGLSGGEIEAFGGITSIDHEVRKGETYIFTNPDRHHMGIGAKAMKLLCHYGFETLGLNKLYAYTNEDNEASIRLHLKAGYQQEGCLRQEYVDIDGLLKNRLYLGILKEDWMRSL